LTVCVAGYEDGVVRTWDVNTGDTVAAFKGQVRKRRPISIIDQQR
jgi:WD40 repeat protein